MASFKSLNVRAFVSVNTRFQIPPKEKNHTLKDRDSEGTTTRLPKREMRCPGNMFRTMVIDTFAVCTVAPPCWKWPTKRKRMPTTSSPHSAYLLSTTHLKDVRFPWVTLYYCSFLAQAEGSCSPWWYFVIWKLREFYYYFSCVVGQLGIWLSVPFWL